jgi:hypothetical protein
VLSDDLPATRYACGLTSRITLNTLPPEARIYYPFHPFVNQTFKVLHRSGGKRNHLILERSSGVTLAVPLWMLKPESGEICIGSIVEPPHKTLLEIIDLLAANCFSLAPPIDVLERLDGTTEP